MAESTQVRKDSLVHKMEDVIPVFLTDYYISTLLMCCLSPSYAGFAQALVKHNESYHVNMKERKKKMKEEKTEMSSKHFTINNSLVKCRRDYY